MIVKTEATNNVTTAIKRSLLLQFKITVLSLKSVSLTMTLNNKAWADLDIVIVLVSLQSSTTINAVAYVRKKKLLLFDLELGTIKHFIISQPNFDSQNPRTHRTETIYISKQTSWRQLSITVVLFYSISADWFRLVSVFGLQL